MNQKHPEPDLSRNAGAEDDLIRLGVEQKLKDLPIFHVVRFCEYFGITLVEDLLLKSQELDQRIEELEWADI